MKLSFGSDKTYSNGQQYKEADFDKRIKSILIFPHKFIILCDDGKMYMPQYDADSALFKEWEKNNYDPYYVLYKKYFEDGNIVKVVSDEIQTESSGNTYLILTIIKTDGNVYEQKYLVKYGKEATIKLIKESIIYSNKDYGKIIDVEFSDEISVGTNLWKSLNKMQITKIISEDGLFYLKQIGEQKYIDSEVTYDFVRSEIYDNYKQDIVYIGDRYIFTKDNNIIETRMICTLIDKEVKNKN